MAHKSDKKQRPFDQCQARISSPANNNNMRHVCLFPTAIVPSSPCQQTETSGRRRLHRTRRPPVLWLSRHNRLRSTFVNWQRRKIIAQRTINQPARPPGRPHLISMERVRHPLNDSLLSLSLALKLVAFHLKLALHRGSLAFG